MILIVTSSGDATADYLCGRLQQAGIAYLRLDTDTFSRDGFVESRNGFHLLRVGATRLSPEDVAAVWYRRPTAVIAFHGDTEAQRLHVAHEWGAALDGFLLAVPAGKWINFPAANAIASNKLHQLVRAQAGGLNVPETLVTASESEALAFFERHSGIIAKPLSTGYVETRDGEVESMIYAESVERRDFVGNGLLARCPTLLQERILGAVDVRVTILDQHVVAVSLLPPVGADPVVDIRRYGLANLQYEPVRLPESTITVLRSLLLDLGLRFGAVDMLYSTSRGWYFLEVNPNGQWAWMDLLGVTDIASSFVSVLS